ncbi:MAG: hypothetical protein ACFB2X_00090 [Rivularia sp. (in: cyanobacteria)]
MTNKLEAVSSVSNQVDNLTKTTEKIEQHLTLLDEANTQTRESLAQALEGNNNQQQENLQNLTNKLEAVSSVSSQVDNLTKTTEKIEQHLTLLDEANAQSKNNPNHEVVDAQLSNQQEQLKVVVEKLAGFEKMKTQIDNVVKTVTKLESSLNQPLEPKKPRSRSTTKKNTSTNS